MGIVGNSNSSAITLEQLIALNEEMAALVRAGVPLEQGLAALGGEMPGRPGQLAELLASRMDAGESLPQILAGEAGRFPPVWRAVVQAGLRSGQLAVALESLSETARRTAELRKLVAAGLVYPIIVVTLAYALFVWLLVWLAPLTLQAHIDLTGDSDVLLRTFDWLGQTAVWWALPLPLATLILLGAWWRRSGRLLWSRQVASTPSRRKRSFWRRGVGFRRTLQNGRIGAFAEVLALLVKQQIPMHDSVVLAAEASGDRRLAQASRQLADRLQSGQALEGSKDLVAGLPPLLGWLLMDGGRQPDLSEILTRSAAVYRDRAARAASWTAVYLPMVLTVFVGGTATLLCMLAIFTPIARLLYNLSAP